MRLSLLCVMLLVCAAGTRSAFEQPAPISGAQVPSLPLPPASSIAPVRSCGSLTELDLTSLPGAPTRVQATKEEPFQGRPFCLVQGYVAPQVQFELRLPIQGYTGRYLQTGCGGNCGVLSTSIAPACDTDTAYSGAFAVGFDNSGHVGGDMMWAANDEQLRLDFAYRSEHKMALAAKAIVAAFYGKAAAHSYYSGCSNGGREALNEVQRYPEDFDGVVAGSPALSIAETVERFAWEGAVGTHPDGSPILNAVKTALLHKAVMDACDALDGARDGQIDDARACHFAPRALLCKGEDKVDCLTGEQVEAAVRLYQGPVDEHGTALYTGGEPYGSELTWSAPPGALQGRGKFGEDFVRFFVGESATEGMKPAQKWSFDLAGFRKLQKAGELYDAKDPHLSAFRDRGGRLLLWQGAADPSAGAYLALNYYAQVQQASGGLEPTRKFARFFLIPGVYHCGRGYVPYEEHLLGAVVRWVELAEPPDQLMMRATLEDGTVRTRPVFAYPVRATYIGKGDINAAESFSGVAPKTPPDDRYRWAGSVGVR